MTIEKYQSIYFEDCLNILKSNTPKYIDPSEQALFESYLVRDQIIYFVLFEKNNVLACGGYGLNKQKTKAGLSWGLVHRKYHKKGFGSDLLKFRLKHIVSNYGNINVKLDTSQKTYKFFEKFGFMTEKVIPDKYGIGLDCYEMILKFK